VLSKLRPRLTYANVMATVAVFIALGGSSYAALKVTGRNVPKDALTGADIKNLTGRDVRNNSLTGADVKNLGSRDVANGRLLAEDFAPGQLPRGERGERGQEGASATKLLAVVDPTCTSIVRGSGAVSVDDFGAGRCDVRFNRDVSACVPIATIKFGGAAFIDTDTGAGFPASFQVDPDEIMVFRYDTAGTGTNEAFNLAVFC
jgi:hypothetical protein